jgi:hypothetical protein
VVVFLQAIPGVYADMLHHLPSEEAVSGAAAAEAAAAPAAAAAWTSERVASEVQSALQEVLGRRLEPSEPFMSGRGCTGRLQLVVT